MQKSVTVQNATGLHARPASMFIQTASKFKSDIFVIKDGNRINAKSIMGIMAAGISQGTEIIIEAKGPDEGEAVEKLAELVESKFGEE
ncbi:HPr family phosphocarrier protein [Irregularibacter muris]|uniref:Phosphocarrier protein HPr n=1 Tax=Irregularibacter muris TaxID=1796619 RepID=A0AAE3L374_9FIRM|nr:HPr family phosphocarrier protein [Irregularibacter muris]MCR1899984.1 HPr family phosphocarrier protein [Irregularibacter muris]